MADEWTAEIRFSLGDPLPSHYVNASSELDAWMVKHNKDDSDYEEFFLTHGIETRFEQGGTDITLKFKTDDMRTLYLLKWS